MNCLLVSRLLCLLAVGSVGLTLHAAETWYETQEGTTYRVTRRVEKRPVAETHLEQQTQTVYATEYVTEMRESTRTTWVPVTQYVYEPRWHQWWNPFAEAYVAYQARPVTRWELRTQTVREPVTMKQQIPQERIVQKPVRALGFVEQPVEERIVVSSPTRGVPATPEVRYAQRPAQPERADFPRLGQPATNIGMPLRR